MHFLFFYSSLLHLLVGKENKQERWEAERTKQNIFHPYKPGECYQQQIESIHTFENKDGISSMD